MLWVNFPTNVNWCSPWLFLTAARSGAFSPDCRGDKQVCTLQRSNKFCSHSSWNCSLYRHQYCNGNCKHALGTPLIQFWTTPWFWTVMPRDRFYLIQEYLNFNDNNLAVNKDHPRHDKLFKIWPVLDIVNETFWLHYSPGMNVSVDEQMIGTKARLSFNQYLPKKPKKWGVKVWVLADSANQLLKSITVKTEVLL